MRLWRKPSTERQTLGPVAILYDPLRLGGHLGELNLRIDVVPILVVSQHSVPRHRQCGGSVRLGEVGLNLEVGGVLNTAVVEVVTGVDHE